MKMMKANYHRYLIGTRELQLIQTELSPFRPHKKKKLKKFTDILLPKQDLSKHNQIKSHQNHNNGIQKVRT